MNFQTVTWVPMQPSLPHHLVDQLKIKSFSGETVSDNTSIMMNHPFAVPFPQFGLSKSYYSSSSNLLLPSPSPSSSSYSRPQKIHVSLNPLYQTTKTTYHNHNDDINNCKNYALIELLFCRKRKIRNEINVKLN